MLAQPPCKTHEPDRVQTEFDEVGIAGHLLDGHTGCPAHRLPQIAQAQRLLMSVQSSS